MSTGPRSGCRLCGQPISTQALPLGELPVCNRFARENHVQLRITLDIVACDTCQLVQLHEPPPPDVLVPEVPWIRYREPEGHLDALVGELLSLKPRACTALGTGPFEGPLLGRLQARGLTASALALGVDGAPGRYPYLETWQATLRAERLAAEAAQLGTFDIVSCRYILEHTPEPVQALQALKVLLNPDGLLLIEVPDSSKFLAARDYCFLWEEHSCYFVEDTLRRLAEVSGYRVLALLRYPGALEDALVVVLTPADGPAPPVAPRGPSSLFQAYRDNFAATRAQLRSKLMALAGPDRDRIALFGIGHHAIMFVNAFGLADLIAVAVDDDADKAGFFPPGLHTPVVGSQRLLDDERIRLCLFAVAPHIEGKVREKLAPLAARGVEFRSIYAALDNSIMRDHA
ncbi:class I SAM-dependent methyltransferase [Bradyrhizobium sp. SZCCHNPS1003]|uniref:class I SAM-dependent methyltransferase n=1 Tax=Bradyrhizobium sp. SZCCHNPS1003 TaxID=3057330 RepID=UPI0028ECC783|nr:class I SAM-dependent methyltransferase [Bradyrhizobium sp. SZCCHNPS1003]